MGSWLRTLGKGFLSGKLGDRTFGDALIHSKTVVLVAPHCYQELQVTVFSLLNKLQKHNLNTQNLICN